MAGQATEARLMRIQIVISEMNMGGAQRVTAHLAGAWARRNSAVEIVTIGPADHDFYSVPPNVGRYALDLREDSSNVLGASFANMRRVVAIRRRIREFKPDVVIGMMTSCSALVAFASLGLSCKSVGSERGYPPRQATSLYWQLARFIASRFLDLHIAQTPEIAKWLTRKTCAKHIKVIPNLLEWPAPQNSPELKPDTICAPDRKVLLSAGRFTEGKGYPYLIRAFSTLAGRHSNWDLVILGDGDEHGAVSRLVWHLGLQDRVHLPGAAGNMHAWYARSSLFAMTSLHEGFPNVLLEAMASGLPVVSFDCDVGPRNIIRNGVDGILVPVADGESLIAALDLLMGSEEERRRCGGRAAEAKDRFGETTILAQWDDALRSVMGLA